MSAYKSPPTADLIHSPLVSTRPHGEDWKVMEQIRKDGLARSIGVSNFREEDIDELSKSWTVPPAVNQVGGKSKR